MRKIYPFVSMLVLCLWLFQPASAQYSGTYSIGGTSPDFASIQEAADSLTQYGVSGAVVMNIRDGVYTEAVMQNAIPGASATNSITFASESGSSGAVTITHASRPTFTGKMAKYLHFDNLHFDNTGDTISIYLHDPVMFSFTNCHFTDTLDYAIIIDSCQKDIESMAFDGCLFQGYGGISSEGIESIMGFTLTNTIIDVDQDAINIGANHSIFNITVNNDSIVSLNGNGLRLEAAGDLKNANVSNLYVHANNMGLSLYANYFNENVNINHADITSDDDYGIYLRGYYGTVRNVNIQNTHVNAYSYGLYCMSDELVDQIDFQNCYVYSSYSKAVYLYGYYTGVTNISSNHNYFNGGYQEGFRIYTDHIVKNISFVHDSIICSDTNQNGYDALYIDSENQQKNVLIDYCYLHTADTSSGGFGADFYNSDGELDILTITNTTVDACGGFDIEGNTWTNNVTIDKCHVRSYDNDCINTYLDDNYAINWRITNSNFYSSSSTGWDIYGSDAAYRNFHIENCSLVSMYRGMDLEAEGEFVNCVIKNCYVKSTDGYALDVEAYNGILRNFIIDSCEFIRVWPGKVCEFEANYQYGDSVSITNSRFVCDSVDINSWGEALDFEADYGDWQNVWIRNNYFKGWDGIDIETDYGSSINVWIDHNTIEAIERAFDIDGMGTGFYFRNNVIRPVDTILRRGIEVRGYEGVSTGEGFNIHDNHITVTDNYGMYIYRGQNIYIKNNTIKAMHGTPNLVMMYISDMSDYFEVTGNKLIASNKSKGIQISSSNPHNTSYITNNFISGVKNGYWASSSSKIHFAHNSVSLWDTNAQFAYLSNGYNMDILNNIFYMHNGAKAKAYYVDLPQLNTEIDYNIFHYDTTGASILENDTVYGLTAWQSLSGFDKHSYYANPGFVNDSNDLHVNCSNTMLNAGMAIPAIMDDIDGNHRSATPTIGADEILTDGHVFYADTAWMCHHTLLDAGSSSGNMSYMWSTGETTQQILVSTAGTYSVTVTDGCGSHTDDIVVWYDPATVASATVMESYFTVGFTNTSINATSYFWDFGDGYTTTCRNPFHSYDWPGGTYTVTLIAYGLCNIDTITFTVNPGPTGVSDQEEGGVLSLYPNPNNGSFWLGFEDIQSEDVMIRIANITGQIVYQEELNNVSSEFRHQLNITNLESGLYFVNVILDDTKVTTFRMMKK